MKRTAVGLIIISVGLLFVAVPTSFGKPGTLESEEYVVYSVLIQTLFTDDDTQQIVIEKRIRKDRRDHKSISNELSWKFSDLEPHTIDDYSRKSRMSADLDNFLSLPVKYYLIEPKEIESFFGQDGGKWKAFFAKYPKSTKLLAFSRVGFNTERNQALVYVNWSCGYLCGGEGTWILLVKKARTWSIRHKFTNLRS